MTVLTALYVPGDRPDRVAKALASGADCVIVDLEDAVAPGHKEEGRTNLAAPAPKDSSIQVRINAAGTPWHEADLAAVASLPPSFGVRVPKVQSADDVAALREALPERDLHALIETALGVERAFEIANAGVASIGLGEADLRSELGLPLGRAGEEGLRWQRSRVVNAAAAAGLPSPMMSVYADVADLDGLAASCREGLGIGFVGRTAIHPRQLPVIRSAFAPTPEQVARARAIIERVASAAADGSGTVVLDDGTFLDAAMVRGAERVLARVRNAR